ncbi:MAG: bifunctional phosphoglucose/phosphomannose isomerase [Candidatus Aenigmarchaeota archaeon]|nr:bifunctional phosphoglucose/phosphomannose isomerase [Candidatus Aenigmarchaeota archaeon]
MLADIRNSLKYVKDVLSSDVKLPADYRQFSNIVICGMGGSAISGDVIKDSFKDALHVPIEVSRNHKLPGYAGSNTLVIAASYSGNTWETLAQLEQAVKRKCKTVCITSGGKMRELAVKKKLPCVKLNEGLMPRVAFPYLLAASLSVFESLKLVKVPEFRTLSKNMNRIENEAKQLVDKINGTMPIIVSHYPSPALRFKTQLNENSKLLAKDEILPEIHHNDVESWHRLDSNFSVIFLRESHEDRDVKNSFDVDKKLLSKRTGVHEVFGEGETRLERILHMIILGDFVSYYMAEKNSIDPYGTSMIDHIKDYLATH